MLLQVPAGEGKDNIGHNWLYVGMVGLEPYLRLNRYNASSVLGYV